MIEELSPLSTSDTERLVDLHLKRLESNKSAKSDASSKQR
jgi:hypothetical protein